MDPEYHDIKSHPLADTSESADQLVQQQISSLDQLPRELLIAIASHIRDKKTLGRLFRCSRVLYSLQDAPDTYAAWLLRHKKVLALHLALGGHSKWNESDTFDRAWRQKLVSIVAASPGVDVNFSRPHYYEGLTPLILACFNGFDFVVEQLLKAPGLDVNKCPHPMPATALHVACERLRPACVALLLGADGIDVNALDHKGQTPLGVMLWGISGFPSKRKRDAVYIRIAEQILARRDVDVNIRDEEEHKTCLHFAIESGIPQLVSLVLRHPSFRLDLFKEEGSNEEPLAVAQSFLKFCMGGRDGGTREGFEAIVRMLSTAQG